MVVRLKQLEIIVDKIFENFSQNFKFYSDWKLVLSFELPYKSKLSNTGRGDENLVYKFNILVIAWLYKDFHKQPLGLTSNLYF